VEHIRFVRRLAALEPEELVEASERVRREAQDQMTGLLSDG